MLRTTVAVILLAGTAAGRSGVAAEPMVWRLPEVAPPAIQERCDRVYLVAQRLARHLLQSVRPWPDDPELLLLTDSRSGENWIRPNAGTVMGLGFLYRFGPYDANEVGISRDELLCDRIVPMIRYLTTTHVTGTRPTSDGRPWGDAWQSALWTSMLGMGAWWLGVDLPVEVADDVRRVVAHEADRIASTEPPHQVRDDSKAEENAWNSQVLSVAVVLMPDDQRRNAWESAFEKWAFSSLLRPADENSDVVVDGRTVAERFTGANIHDDFTLENHGIVHPDYMTAYSQTLGCMLEYRLTGRKPPEALLHNVAGLYENLKWLSLPDGGFMYPSGQDWMLYRQADWLYPHALMAVYGNDREAWVLADRCLEVLERMQARTDSGTVYLPEETFFASSQSDKLTHFSSMWLTLHFADRFEPADPRREGVRPFDSGRFVLNRTPSAVHSFSWGAKVMAHSVAMRKDRLVSPHERSGVGFVQLKGHDAPLPVTLADVRVDHDDRTFAVDLVVHHGDSVEARLRYRSRADGTWQMAEKLVALREVTTSRIATGLIGVLNDRNWIYQRGERRVRIGDQRAVVPSCAGVRLRADGVGEVAVDEVLHVRSDQGLLVGYVSAAAPQRGRVTDELYLNVIDGEHTWQAGRTISEFQAEVRFAPQTP